MHRFPVAGSGEDRSLKNSCETLRGSVTEWLEEVVCSSIPRSPANQEQIERNKWRLRWNGSSPAPRLVDEWRRFSALKQIKRIFFVFARSLRRCWLKKSAILDFLCCCEFGSIYDDWSQHFCQGNSQGPSLDWRSPIWWTGSSSSGFTIGALKTVAETQLVFKSSKQMSADERKQFPTGIISLLKTWRVHTCSCICASAGRRARWRFNSFCML